VWAGYCLWIGGLSSIGVSLVFLIVNLLAYSGLLRSSSWSESNPLTGPRMIYPWLIFYAFLNLSILPTVIILLYVWYEVSSTECSNSFPTICKSQLLRLWVPLISVLSLVTLAILLHNWVVVLRVTLMLRRKLSPLPFTRIGDRIVLGLQHTKDMERKNTLLNGELISDLSFEGSTIPRKSRAPSKSSGYPVIPWYSCTCGNAASTMDRRSVDTRSSRVENLSMYENKTRF